MQFYKKRDFGNFITDSFNFFKLYGKNYFKNYILLNGILLILLVAVFIFGYKEILSHIFGSNLDGDASFLENYFNDNLGLIVGVSVITVALFFVMTVINYLFPVFYIKRLAEGQTKIQTDDILFDFKTNLSKIGILCLGMIFIVLPISILLLGISYAMMLIFIGFFLLLFVFPVLVNLITFLMYDSFNTKRGFFESLSYSIRSQFSYTNGREKSPFWKYWGSTIIISIVLYVITTIFTAIPMIITFSTSMVSPEDPNFNENPFGGTMGIVILVTYGISILMNFLLSNLIYVNSGLMYYDSRTDLHQELDLKEIDTIGINE